MAPPKRAPGAAPYPARRLTQLTIIACFSLCYFATVLLLTRSPHSSFLCDSLSPASFTDPFLQSLSHASASTAATAVATGCDGDGGSAWHDTAISAASQGKLWTPRRLRTFPVTSLLDFNNISNSNSDTERMPQLVTPRPNCTLWAVVTTIFAPSRTLHQLRALPAETSSTTSAGTNPDYASSNSNSWCVVVVGDRKTDDDAWRQFVANRSHMHYLSAADQESSRLLAGYRLLRHVPWNHFGRKNVGYLFAVHHGARLIWDTDDDNELHAASDDDNDGDGERDRLLTLTRLYNIDDDNSDNDKRGGVRREADGETSALSAQLKAGMPVIDSRHALANPYPYFRPVDAVSGDRVPGMWPRGFPLPLVKSVSPAVMSMAIINTSISPSTTTTTTRVGVVQSLADNDPDVDALFRLTRPLPLRFTHVSGPSLALPLGRYTPFNAQATLWSADAFALLLLPMSVHGRVSDIWRAYIAQTVMRFVGLHVAVHGVPVVTQRRNVHSYLADLQAELPLYTHAGALVQYLQNWTPPSPPSLSSLSSTEMKTTTTTMDVPHIMQAMLVDLYELGVVQLVDVHATQMWISDLIDIGVRFPPVVGDGATAATEGMHGGNEAERQQRKQQQQQTSETPPSAPAQVASIEEARRPRVALCVGDGRGLSRQSHDGGSNSTLLSSSFARQQLSVDVVAIARDIETHFANAAVTLFVVGNSSSSSRTSGTVLTCSSSASAPELTVQGAVICVGVSAGRAVAHPESSQTQSEWQAHWHSSRCARAVDARELAMDEAFDWVFSVSAATTADMDADKDADKDVDVQVHRLPLPEDAAMRHTAVFRARAQCPAKAGAEAQADLVFGKRMAMREFMAGPEEGVATGLVEVVRHAEMDVRCGGGGGRGAGRAR